MAKNIRSKYIKNLIESQKDYENKIEETTKDTLRSILKDTVSEEFKRILSESDDDYEEEEVTPVEPEDKAEDTTAAEVEDLEGGGDAAEEETEPAVDEPLDGEETEPAVDEPLDDEEPEVGEEGEDEELWKSLEQYKDEDGEYNLTSLSAEDAAKVLKVMKPEDGVRIVKTDGRIELSDDETGAEYIIELEPDADDEAVVELELDEPVNEVKNTGNTGYTDDYQHKTAMTMDPDDGEKTRKWNAGTPTGNGKRWVGNKGDMSPFNKKVDEGIVLEVETDECALGEKAETVANGSRTMKDLHNKREGQARHDRHRLGAKNPTMNREDDGESRSNESIKRMANEIFLENKQLKQVAKKIMAKLDEAYVLNYNLGKVIKLVTENSTTRDEKVDIVKRFNESRSIDESKKLYEQISRELSSTKQTSNVDNVVNGQQLAEAKQRDVVETSMYQSEDLYKTIDMMERMAKIK